MTALSVSKRIGLDTPRIMIGLSRLNIHTIRQTLLKTTCSSAWVDAQFVPVVVDGVTTERHVDRVYPPPADTTPMKLCHGCLIPNPANVCTEEFAVGSCKSDARIFKRWAEAMEYKAELISAGKDVVVVETGLCLDCMIARSPVQWDIKNQFYHRVFPINLSALK